MSKIKGGEFVVRNCDYKEIFIPEEFGEEQKMMAQACRDFVRTEITPHIERMDSMEEGFMPSLLEKAGQLGLLGVSIPTEYEGLGMDITTSMLMADMLGDSGSFGTAYGAHTGIGTLPIFYYGNQEQKKKYLPKLVTGEWKASYCLTEPNAGSDANSGKTKAVLSADGKNYLITGQKMWISNAGFADLFIVFAKIDDDKNLSAFIVERTFPGITMNPEEKKLGIKGSSTRQVFFNDCPVPVENMLSERENGFKIAVNILNIGRIKLGAATIGACKEVITRATLHAINRQQFGTSIANFGAIKHKLAEMSLRTLASESATYRAGKDIDDKIAELRAAGMSETDAKLKGTEEFAIECAIAKIIGSEVLDYVVDEGVQIYGGMGYSAEADMERAYRDSRIARIYEGTNEINRMLMVGMLLKKAMSGSIDLFGPAMAVSKELTSVPSFEGFDAAVSFAYEKDLLYRLKKCILMIGGKAAQVFMQNIESEQEILMNIADMMIEVYVAESLLLRAEKLLHSQGEQSAAHFITAAKLYLAAAADKVNTAGKEAIGSFVKGDELRVMMLGLKRFTKSEPLNTKEMRRKLADACIARKGYAFDYV